MTATPVPAGAPRRRRAGRPGSPAGARGVARHRRARVAGRRAGGRASRWAPWTSLLAPRSRSSRSASWASTSAVTWPATAEAIVMDLRLPRVLTAMVVGTGLAVAGATFQGLLRNPLADPYVLGTASGAALGAAIAVLIPVRGLILEFGLLHGLAFVGALGSVTVVYRLSRTSPLAPLTSLLLTGLRGGVAAVRGPGHGHVPVRDGPAADLRVPAGRVRRDVLGPSRRRRAADHRRQRAHPAPGAGAQRVPAGRGGGRAPGRGRAAGAGDPARAGVAGDGRGRRDRRA